MVLVMVVGNFCTNIITGGIFEVYATVAILGVGHHIVANLLSILQYSHFTLLPWLVSRQAAAESVKIWTPLEAKLAKGG